MGQTLNLILVLAWIGIVGGCIGIVLSAGLRLPPDLAFLIGIGGVFLVAVFKRPVRLFRLIFRQEPVHWSEIQPEPTTMVRTWRGSDERAAIRHFERDLPRLDAAGWEPVTTVWAPGRRGLGDYLVALLLSLTVIGIVALLYVLVVSPSGTLMVTFRMRETRTVVPLSAIALAAPGLATPPAPAPPAAPPPPPPAAAPGRLVLPPPS